jgi:hypothetical protein
MIRAFLSINALIWFPYGAYLFIVPGALEGIAGIAATSATGSIEIRAMYGGLQMAIGALCGAGLLRSALERSALTAVAFLTAGLFTTRVLGAVSAGELSAYTIAALLLELSLSATAGRLLAIAADVGE